MYNHSGGLLFDPPGLFFSFSISSGSSWVLDICARPSNVLPLLQPPLQSNHSSRVGPLCLRAAFQCSSIDRVHGDILKVGTDKSKAVKLTKGNAAKYVRGKATFVKAVNTDDEIDKTKKISDADLKKYLLSSDARTSRANR